MRPFLICLMTMAFLFLAMKNRTALSVEYVVNGGFETGDFRGWQVLNASQLDTWVINGGTLVPLTSRVTEDEGPLAPISGNYDAMTVWGGPCASYLYQQTVTLPLNITSATLSWSDRIRNYDDDFVPWMQDLRVFIFSCAGGEKEVFSTQPGDPPIQVGPNKRSFDLTSLVQSLEDQEIMIVFFVSGQYWRNNITVDDVSLDISTVVPCMTVGVDIKPGSESNCINNNGHGVIPIAILGTEDFDVTAIDAGSVMLEGLSVKTVGKSNKLLAHYEDVNADGYQDLVVQIEDTDTAFGEGQTTATLTGNLYSGMCIEGSDPICIVP